MTHCSPFALVMLALLLPARAALAETSVSVRTSRLPQGAIQPQIAVGEDGRAHLVYFRGDARHGGLAWQVFGADGRSIAGAAGRAAGVPVWSVAAACAGRDGEFVIVY